MRGTLLAWSRRPRARGDASSNLYDEETEARQRALGYID